MLSGGIHVQTDKTVDSCFLLPVLPHKLGNVRDFWDDVSEKFRDEMEDQLKGVGIKRILAFLQAMPEKGDFLIIFMQSADGLGQTLQEMFATDDEYSKYLTEQFKDFTGIDLSNEANAPDVELLFDWKDRQMYREEKDMLTMPWCFGVPLKPGKTDEVYRLIERSKAMIPEVEKIARDHDIIRSLSYLQHISGGDFILRHIVASTPLDDLISKFVSCDDEICKKSRAMAMEMTGLDLSDPDQQPHVELLFKWDDRHGFETADQVIAYTE
jgi:hypothetical protein